MHNEAYSVTASYSDNEYAYYAKQNYVELQTPSSYRTLPLPQREVAYKRLVLSQMKERRCLFKFN